MEFTPGESIYHAREILFSWLDFRDEEWVRDRLHRLLGFLEGNKQIDLKIGSVAFYEGMSQAFLQEIGKARAEKIRAWFIERGIDPKRVYTFDPHGTALMEEYQGQIPEMVDQLTFLIPE